MSCLVGELQPRSGTLPRLRGLRSKAILDVAAERLHIELRGGRSGERQAQVAAHRFAFDLPVGRQCKFGFHIAGHALESPPADVSEFDDDLAEQSGNAARRFAAISVLLPRPRPAPRCAPAATPSTDLASTSMPA